MKRRQQKGTDLENDADERRNEVRSKNVMFYFKRKKNVRFCNIRRYFTVFDWNVFFRSLEGVCILLNCFPGVDSVLLHDVFSVPTSNVHISAHCLHILAHCLPTQQGESVWV